MARYYKLVMVIICVVAILSFSYLIFIDSNDDSFINSDGSDSQSLTNPSLNMDLSASPNLDNACDFSILRAVDISTGRLRDPIVMLREVQEIYAETSSNIDDLSSYYESLDKFMTYVNESKKAQDWESLLDAISVGAIQTDFISENGYSVFDYLLLNEAPDFVLNELEKLSILPTINSFVHFSGQLNGLERDLYWLETFSIPNTEHRVLSKNGEVSLATYALTFGNIDAYIYWENKGVVANLDYISQDVLIKLQQMLSK